MSHDVVKDDEYFCVHEAAHAVVGHVLGLVIPYVIVQGGGGGHAPFISSDGQAVGPMIHSVFLCAGPEASDVKLKGQPPGTYFVESFTDIDKVYELLGQDLPSIKAAQAQARELVETHWESIRALAERLKAKRNVPYPFVETGC